VPIEHRTKKTSFIRRKQPPISIIETQPHVSVDDDHHRAINTRFQSKVNYIYLYGTKFLNSLSCIADVLVLQNEEESEQSA
jgi:hypothetical protein